MLRENTNEDLINWEDQADDTNVSLSSDTTKGNIRKIHRQLVAVCNGINEENLTNDDWHKNECLVPSVDTEPQTSKRLFEAIYYNKVGAKTATELSKTLTYKITEKNNSSKKTKSDCKLPVAQLAAQIKHDSTASVRTKSKQSQEETYIQLLQSVCEKEINFEVIFSKLLQGILYPVLKCEAFEKLLNSVQVEEITGIDIKTIETELQQSATGILDENGMKQDFFNLALSQSFHIPHTDVRNCGDVYLDVFMGVQQNMLPHYWRLAHFTGLVQSELSVNDIIYNQYLEKFRKMCN